jgi:hypothetical protein
VANKFTISSVFTAVDKVSSVVASMTKKVDGMGASASKAQRLLGGIGQAGAVAAKGVAVIGGAALAAGTAVFGLAMKASAAASSVNDVAAAIGISTRALQEYRYLGVLAGVSTDEMDKALEKLTINLGKGGTELERMLGSVGLSVEQLKAAGPDRVLETLAEAFQGETDQAKKAAIVTSLFGKSSIKMVAALSGGTEGLAEMRAEAEALGYVMDDVSVKAGDEMGDAFDKMKMAAGGALNRIGAAFMPMVTKALDGITAFIAKNGAMLDGVVAGLGAVFESLGPIMAKVGPLVIDALNKILPIFTKLLEAAMPVLEQIMDAFIDIMPAVIDLAEAVGKVLVPVFKLLGPILDLLLPLITGLINGVAKLVEWIMNLIKPVLDFLAKGAEFISNIFGGGGKGVKGPKEPVDSVGGRSRDAKPPAASTGRGVPITPQASVIESRSSVEQTWSGTLDITGAPAGSTLRTSGASAPAVTLSTGPARGRSR